VSADSHSPATRRRVAFWEGEKNMIPACGVHGEMELEMGLKKFLNSTRFVPYVFISPFFIVWGIFGAFPMIFSIWLSLQRWESVGNFRFIGLANYINVFHRPETAAAFVNILWYVVFLVSLTVILPLLLASVLNMPRLRFRSVFRAAFFLPYLASGVAVSIIFTILFSDEGLINNLLNLHINWLTSTFWSKPSVLISGLWQVNGFWMIIYLGALQTVPLELYEAATVDGAGPVRSFFQITLPSIGPIIIVNVIMATIWTMQLFDIPKVLTKGGPINSSTTPVLEIYNSGFLNFNLGHAAAFGWILALAIMVVAALQIFVTRKSTAL
jgi:ABC-type sugar transport system permease subunit